MAATVTTISAPIASAKLIVDTVSNATAENNVTGAAATVYMVEIDNTANAAISYLKLYDNAAPTVGTTDPNIILPAGVSRKDTFFFPAGLVFGTALSFATVTAPGTGGTSNPSSSVIVRAVGV